MIKIKAWFGNWYETDFEGAKSFFDQYRKGVPEKAVKENWSKHFRGVSYEELRA